MLKIKIVYSKRIYNLCVDFCLPMKNIIQNIHLGARSATTETRALGALKLASDENLPAKRADFFHKYILMF